MKHLRNINPAILRKLRQAGIALAFYFTIPTYIGYTNHIAAVRSMELFGIATDSECELMSSAHNLNWWMDRPRLVEYHLSGMRTVTFSVYNLFILNY